MTSFDTIFEQRQLAHATTIENVAHVWVQAQTSHRWQMEAYEPTSDHITAISNTVGLANPTIVSNFKRQLLAVTLSGPMSTGYDPMSLRLHRATHCHDQSSCKLLMPLIYDCCFIKNNNHKPQGPIGKLRILDI